MKKDSDRRKKAESETLRDFQVMQHQTEMGQKAVIERHAVPAEQTEEFRQILNELGHACQLPYSVPSGCDYVGSFACHIYIAPKTKTVYFVTQDALRGCPEMLVSDAFTDCRGTLMENYSRSRQKKRSGF